MKSFKLNNENPVLNFRVGVRVGGHPPANFSYGSKDVLENSTFFDTNLMGSVGRRKKNIFYEKSSKKSILRRLKSRGLSLNRINL